MCSWEGKGQVAVVKHPGWGGMVTVMDLRIKQQSQVCLTYVNLGYWLAILSVLTSKIDQSPLKFLLILCNQRSHGLNEQELKVNYRELWLFIPRGEPVYRPKPIDEGRPGPLQQGPHYTTKNSYCVNISSSIYWRDLWSFPKETVHQGERNNQNFQ